MASAHQRTPSFRLEVQAQPESESLTVCKSNMNRTGLIRGCAGPLERGMMLVVVGLAVIRLTKILIGFIIEALKQASHLLPFQFGSARSQVRQMCAFTIAASVIFRKQYTNFTTIIQSRHLDLTSELAQLCWVILALCLLRLLL
jgi:hypothetical protein